LAALKRSELSAGTVAGYTVDLREYLAWAEADDLPLAKSLDPWREYLRGRVVKAVTANRKLAAVKAALWLVFVRGSSSRGFKKLGCASELAQRPGEL
jgi:site-specific recombinase XerD